MRFIAASAYALFTLFTVCDSYPTGKSTLSEHSISPGANPPTKRSPLPGGTASLSVDLVSQQESNIAIRQIFPLTTRGIHSEPHRDGQNITINFMKEMSSPDALNDQEEIEAAAYAKASILLLLDSAAEKLGIHLPYNVRFYDDLLYPCSKAVAEEKGFNFVIRGIPDCPTMGTGSILEKSAGTATIKCGAVILTELYTGNLVPNQNAPFWNRMKVFADYLRSWKPSTSS
ncbi:hypothetical protein DFH05DRAFT_1529218 [Lentinula detonsa]|uniref:Uncharacterized protein n=1 Tax=Lentinula detonsa TaxID=2804962 RepID=A0A9W8NTJ6_9AGAR|nr:hypothetical protein DFH05DRAFT_1529218 [Lentinula detonsa]